MADVVQLFPDGYLLSDKDVVPDVQKMVDADGVVVVVVDSDSDRIGTMYGLATRSYRCLGCWMVASIAPASWWFYPRPRAWVCCRVP